MIQKIFSKIFLFLFTGAAVATSATAGLRIVKNFETHSPQVQGIAIDNLQPTPTSLAPSSTPQLQPTTTPTQPSPTAKTRAESENLGEGAPRSGEGEVNPTSTPSYEKIEDDNDDDDQLEIHEEKSEDHEEQEVEEEDEQV